MVSNKQTELMRQRGYLTVSEAAKRCGVSDGTVRRWIQEGEVREVRVGKRHFVERKSLADYLGTSGALALGLGSLPPKSEP